MAKIDLTAFERQRTVSYSPNGITSKQESEDEDAAKQLLETSIGKKWMLEKLRDHCYKSKTDSFNVWDGVEVSIHLDARKRTSR